MAESSTAVHVNSIRVEGARVTRTGVMETVLQPVLHATSFEQATRAVHQACCRLEQLQIMDSFEVSLDLAKGPLVPDDSIDVVIKGREKGRFWAKTGTEFGNSEGNAHTSANFRNVLGGGESIAISGSVGTRTSASNQMTFSTPIHADPRKSVEMSAYQQSQTFQATSSHDQLHRGFNLRYKSAASKLYHELGYSAIWRRVGGLGNHASPSMRVEAGHDIKSAVYLSLLGDYRDNPLLSTRGYMWKLYAELAGLGGDARFIKQEGQTQGSVNLGRGFVLSASARAGLIKPLQGNAVSIADRFFLGGPTSLRGYHQFGVGPRDQSDALGGTVHWATGLSLFTPLPNVDTDMLKGHLWANAGALASVPHGGTLANTLATSLQRPTTSLGCGLVFHYSMMRLELNFALPITATIWDQAKKGWQFGLGVDFL